MKICNMFTVFLLCNILHHSKGADILIFHNVASYSHHVQTWPLAEALSARGHNVSYVSPYYSKHPNPNITEFVPKKLAKFADRVQASSFNIGQRVKKTDSFIDTIFDYSSTACEALYTSPDFETWLSKNRKFDLVIIDSCFDHECGVGLAFKLSAKYIYFGTIAPVGYEFDALGFPSQSSAIPVLGMDVPSMPFGFYARLSNTMNVLRWRFWHSLHSIKMDEYIRRKLNVPDMRYIGDLVRNPGIVLYTGNALIDYSRTLPPYYISVAGIHCKDTTNALPEDIQNFLKRNAANAVNDDGFIYISFGSLIVSSDLPENIKQVFFQTIRSFPSVKFLWKWNSEFPENLPENLFLRNWFPQADVLAHKKIRGFVSQAGRPSTLEALYNGVPMISFPVFGDQDLNANRLAEIGASTKLEIGTVTLKELTNAINITVYDLRVKDRMAELQKIFRDRPMNPVDTAVWWTEYALRTDDMSHLRPAGADQFWFVRRQVDVWAFLCFPLFIAFSVLLRVFCHITTKIMNINVKVKRA